MNLLLRSYAFVQLHHTEAPQIERPNLVIISDAYIDHNHKALKARYWVNEAEAKGEAGEDDDGNGFIDDVYGWNAEDDEPLRGTRVCQYRQRIERLVAGEVRGSAQPQRRWRRRAR